MIVKVLRKVIVTYEDHYDINEKEFLEYCNENGIEEIDEDIIDFIFTQDPCETYEYDYEPHDEQITYRSLEDLNNLLINEKVVD